MKTTSIRKRLQQYIDEGDEKLIRLMYAVAHEYHTVPEEDISHELPGKISGNMKKDEPNDYGAKVRHTVGILPRI